MGERDFGLVVVGKLERGSDSDSDCDGEGGGSGSGEKELGIYRDKCGNKDSGER